MWVFVIRPRAGLVQEPAEGARCGEGARGSGGRGRPPGSAQLGLPVLLPQLAVSHGCRQVAGGAVPFRVPHSCRVHRGTLLHHAPGSDLEGESEPVVSTREGT